MILTLQNAFSNQARTVSADNPQATEKYSVCLREAMRALAWMWLDANIARHRPAASSSRSADASFGRGFGLTPGSLPPYKQAMALVFYRE
jgi:hypothetical protein